MVFRQLCGDNCCQNVVLGTTFWKTIEGNSSCLEIAHARVKELTQTDKFWGSMIKRGSQVYYIPDTQEAGRTLLLRLAQKASITLQLQNETVHQGKSLEKTAAGLALRSELEKIKADNEKERRQMQENFDREMKERERLQKHEEARRKLEMQKEMKRQEKERRRLEAEQKRQDAEMRARQEAAKKEQERLAQEQAKLEQKLAKMRIEQGYEDRMKKSKTYMREVHTSVEHLVNVYMDASDDTDDFNDIPVLVYSLYCNNCFANIGAKESYSKTF